MDGIRMTHPQHRLAAIRAHRNGRLGVNWGEGGPLAAGMWANRQGWKLPHFFGVKKAFIRRMLESDEKFEAALTKSGIDVYIPDHYVEAGVTDDR